MIDRREEIADTLKKYFHHYGLKKTSLDDVSAELHISKKTIYEYFESKDAAFAYVIQREAVQAGRTLTRKLEEIPTAVEKIRALIHFIFDYASLYLKNSQNLDLNDKDEIVFLSFRAAYETILQQIVEKGVETGEFHFINDALNYSFLKAIIGQGLQTMKQDPVERVEHSTCMSVLKLLS